MQESRAAASKENSVPFVGLKINQIAEACRENAANQRFRCNPQAVEGVGKLQMKEGGLQESA